MAVPASPCLQKKEKSGISSYHASVFYKNHNETVSPRHLRLVATAWPTHCKMTPHKDLQEKKEHIHGISIRDLLDYVS